MNLQDISGPLNHGELEAKTDAEEGYLLFSGVLNSEHHAFCAAVAESTWNEDPARRSESDEWIRRLPKWAYPAPTTALHASWYRAGADSCVSASRSEDSTHYRGREQTFRKNAENGMTNMNDQLSMHPESRVFQSFCYRHVRVLQIGVFSDKCNSYGVKQPLLP